VRAQGVSKSKGKGWKDQSKVFLQQNESRGLDSGGDLTNIQCKCIWNCHNESLLYNEYILIKIYIYS
jgi:hypothetical protein